jgi:LPXTG-site transpeptidase (sortase) family protein
VVKINFYKLTKINYRFKLSLALVALILCSIATVIAYRHFNFKVSADIKNLPFKEQQYLPTISYTVGDFMLRIDKLSINAPVVPDVDGADKDAYFASLQRGVAQMEGTAKPDEKGNVVIFGHSNFYENDPGGFKQIFRNLDQLQKDDEILIRYKDNDYKYKVMSQQIVKPTDTWVISAKYDLTLITCWPPGTIEKRLIVFANKES